MWHQIRNLNLLITKISASRRWPPTIKLLWDDALCVSLDFNQFRKRETFSGERPIHPLQRFRRSRFERLYPKTERRQSRVFWITPPLALLCKAETLQAHCPTVHYEKCLFRHVLTVHCWHQTFENKTSFFFSLSLFLQHSWLSLSYHTILQKTSL